MALTAKPISTISYNTEAHLKRVLDQFFNDGRIEDYRYICHEGEDGDKDHIHLFVYPNRRIDTVDFRKEFKEIVPYDERPLECMPFRSSAYDHWIMYVVHDPEYLKAHQSDNDGDGKIPYSIEDIVTPFPDQLMRDYKKALRLRNTENQKVVKKIKEGADLLDIVCEENISPTKVLATMNLYRMQDALNDIQRVNKMKEEEAIQIKTAIDVVGEVRVEEDLGATKMEKRLGLTRVQEKVYQLDMKTGEYVEVESKIETRGDDDER